MSMFTRLRLAFGTKLFQKRDLRLTVPAGSCLVLIKNIRGRMSPWLPPRFRFRHRLFLRVSRFCFICPILCFCSS